MLGEDHPGTLIAAAHYCRILIRMNRAAQARPLLADVHKRQQKIFGSDNPDVLSTYLSLAVALYRVGKVGRARHVADSVMAGYRRKFGEGADQVRDAEEQLKPILRVKSRPSKRR
nr:tetratricopeptide repeat protein [Saccharopolyspora shandongensis]